MKLIKTSFMLLLIFTLLTGLVYPLLVTGIAQLLFPWQANGSLIDVNDEAVGSALIGQPFDSPYFFWGRPSATTPYPYNAANSSGSNMGPTNPDFLKTVQKRVHFLRQKSKSNDLIPVDLVTASGSGLDPDISPLAAFYQVPRIAKKNHISEEEVIMLIENNIKNRTFFMLGEPRVNVLALNIALQKLRNIHGRASTQSR